MAITKSESDFLALIGAGRVVVDCGCGDGRLLAAHEGRFAVRVGIDRQLLCGDDVKQSRGFEFKAGDLNEELPLPQNYADALAANQVIEHIVNPYHFAREALRVLVPGGRCVITTPNVRYIKVIGRLLFTGDGLRTAGGNTLDGEWDDGHLHYFTHRDLRSLFLSVGFSKVCSIAQIGFGSDGAIRRTLARLNGNYIVREFLSGCIMLCAVK